MPTYRSLAHNRDFTALWIGATVSELGSRVSTFAMPLVAYAMTGSAFWAATAEAVYLGGLLLTLLPAGVLADRCDRRLLMRASHGTGAVVYASLVVAGVLGSLTLPHLLGAALLTGLAAGLFQPAETSAIRTVVSTEELPTALSQQQARKHVAGLLGGPLGGALFGIARWAPFAGDAISYAAGWLLLGRIRADLAAPRRSDARPVRDLREGVRFTWHHPLFRVLLLWTPLVNLTVNALFFVALLRLISAGFPAWQIGLVEAVIGCCGILGALAAPWLIERLPTGHLTVLVAWSFVPLAVPLALWNHPIAMAGAASIGLFLNPAGNAGIGAYRMAITPPELLGRVQSAMQFVSMLAMPLAPIVAGGLLAILGGRDAVLALAALTAASALIPTCARTVRTLPRPDRWRTGEVPSAVPA
ncbi:MFS transporter [Nocardioides panacisoli]|uniref:MFS transporter n=1 Tax=Nocardioides panacisoli TaxID=627624 RepID=UPI001C62DF6C|nr:MFS transporter [Nocardioides panacisoli]QYJ02847.1 MFS transporter [Nocardioides panacisoli]